MLEKVLHNGQVDRDRNMQKIYINKYMVNLSL